MILFPLGTRLRRFPAIRALAVTIGILMTITPTTGGASPTDDEKIVAGLDTEYQAAVKKNDVNTMDRILADDFVLVTGRGKTYTKADLLKEAQSKRLSMNIKRIALRQFACGAIRQL